MLFGFNICHPRRYHPYNIIFSCVATGYSGFASDWSSAEHEITVAMMIIIITMIRKESWFKPSMPHSTIPIARRKSVEPWFTLLAMTRSTKNDNNNQYNTVKSESIKSNPHGVWYSEGGADEVYLVSTEREIISYPCRLTMMRESRVYLLVWGSVEWGRDGLS